MHISERVRESQADRAGARQAQTLLHRVCDRSDCPAPAVRELTLSGQDFYFCNHHAAEIEHARQPTRTAGGRREDADRHAPAPVP